MAFLSHYCALTLHQQEIWRVLPHVLFSLPVEASGVILGVVPLVIVRYLRQVGGFYLVLVLVDVLPLVAQIFFLLLLLGTIVALVGFHLLFVVIVVLVYFHVSFVIVVDSVCFHV